MGGTRRHTNIVKSAKCQSKDKDETGAILHNQLKQTQLLSIVNPSRRYLQSPVVVAIAETADPASQLKCLSFSTTSSLPEDGDAHEPRSILLSKYASASIAKPTEHAAITHSPLQPMSMA